jgi:polyisoprenyl-phosphate glycosyltransferase
MPSSDKPKISVILPVYKNSQMLVELYQRLTHVLRKSGYPYELVFVDDYSPDDSILVLKQLSLKDAAMKALRLSQNVGQQRATLQGFRQATGKIIVTMDADLQDPPEAIPSLINKFEEGFDVVFAGRAGKYESWHRLLFSKLYKWLLHLFTASPPDAGYYMVMKAEIAKKLINQPGKDIHIVARVGSLNPKMISIPVIRSERPSGKSAVHSISRLDLGIKAIFWLICRRLQIPMRKEKEEIEPKIESYFSISKE